MLASPESPAMIPERWRQVTDIFHAARVRPLLERDAFLAVACHDDLSLRQEVEALLAGHDQAGSFGETPLASTAATMKPGSWLGSFRIEALIGTGGMGEVYRAHDAKLKRDVALKVLPRELKDDPERRLRLVREARAIAALSHPNIVSVFDVEHEPVPFIVTELLDGETLRGVLRQGPLSAQRAIDLAQQLTTALVAAHERGIIHRDLKPDNLFLTRGGVVKILDFGLVHWRFLGRGTDCDPSRAAAAPEQGAASPGAHHSAVS